MIGLPRARIAAALSAVCLLACTASLPVRADNREQQLANQQQQAQQAYENAQNQLEDLQNQQAETESQIDQLQGKASDVAAQLSSVYTALQEADRNLLEQQALADEAAEALAQTQQAYDDSLLRCKEQLRAMQVLEGGGAIGLLAQADSLYQLLTFTESLQQISAKNEEILQDLDTQAAALEEAKQQAEAARQQAEEAKTALDAQQNQLSDTQTQLQTAL